MGGQAETLACSVCDSKPYPVFACEIIQPNSALKGHMSLPRFTTDRRLWFWISLVLFAAPWFVCTFGKDDDHPIMLLRMIVTQPSHFVEVLPFILAFTLLFGIPAVILGWVVHCILVIVRDAVWKKPKTEVSPPTSDHN
jgi:hypothetical protein